VKNPVTLRVPVGISLQELMDAAGGPTCDCKYIIGGPCMGRVVDTLDIPVTKTTGGLLAIPKDHPLLERKSPKLNLQLIMSVCCQCSMCTQMCPRNALGLNVQPHKLVVRGFSAMGAGTSYSAMPRRAIRRSTGTFLFSRPPSTGP